MARKKQAETDRALATILGYTLRVGVTASAIIVLAVLLYSLFTGGV